VTMASEAHGSRQEYPYYRRNLLAFIGDSVFFRVGVAFLDSATVLPVLVRHLTGSASLVGLTSSISRGLWLFPQLLVANYVTGKARQKPYLIVPVLIGRSFTWPLALLLFVGLERRTILFVALILWVAVFWLCDGLAGVSWFRLISKTIPPARRGRLFGLGQALGGALAVGAGGVIRHLLSDQGPPFPTNYAWLFVLGGAAFFISLGLVSLVKEDPEPTRVERRPWRIYLSQLVTLLRRDRDFRLVTVVRLLLGASGMAAPFYILHATEEMGLPQEMIGFFVSVQVGSGVLMGLLMGYLHERMGSRRVIQLSTVMGLMSPLGALLIPRMVPSRGTTLLWAYALVFVGLQGVMSAMVLGFMNFIMEIAPPEEEPIYVGLANTLGALLLIYPLLGGVLLGSVAYSGLFIITALAIGAALLLAMRLREPRAAELMGWKAADSGAVLEG